MSGGNEWNLSYNWQDRYYMSHYNRHYMHHYNAPQYILRTSCDTKPPEYKMVELKLVSTYYFGNNMMQRTWVTPDGRAVVTPLEPANNLTSPIYALPGTIDPNAPVKTGKPIFLSDAMAEAAEKSSIISWRGPEKKSGPYPSGPEKKDGVNEGVGGFGAGQLSPATYVYCPEDIDPDDLILGVYSSEDPGEDECDEGAEPPPEESKQETWRDRPPLLW